MFSARREQTRSRSVALKGCSSSGPTRRQRSASTPQLGVSKDFQSLSTASSKPIEARSVNPDILGQTYNGGTGGALARSTGPKDAKTSTETDERQECSNDVLVNTPSLQRQSQPSCNSPRLGSPSPEVLSVRPVQNTENCGNRVDLRESRSYFPLEVTTMTPSGTAPAVPVTNTTTLIGAAADDHRNNNDRVNPSMKVPCPEINQETPIGRGGIKISAGSNSSKHDNGLTHPVHTVGHVASGSLTTLKRRHASIESESGKRFKTVDQPMHFGQNRAPLDDIQVVSCRTVGNRKTVAPILKTEPSTVQLQRAQTGLVVHVTPPSASSSRQWVARPWTSTQYAALAQVCYQSFPFEDFQVMHGKSREEVREVFAAVIQAPLLSRGGLGDDRVKERRKREQELSAVHRRYHEVDAREKERERQEMRKQVEMEVWRKMDHEGWVKLEHAKNMLADKEKQVEESQLQAKQTPGGRGRRGPRIMSVEEATAELQAASGELEKAKKAEQRKAKRMEKKELEGKGRTTGKGDDYPRKFDSRPVYGKKGF